jgi:chaperonin GroEL
MNELGYSPKNLAFDTDARQRLIEGIGKISKAVKSTLGPAGQTVLIESQNHTGGLTVTKDGVTVAKSIDLLDPIENLAVKMMKQAADKTALDAGDGTTTSIVLAEAIVKELLDHILNAGGSKKGINKTELLKEIVSEAENYAKLLDTHSIKMTKKMVEDVATISCNSDKVLGKIIADAYNRVGKNGIVTVEKGTGEKTYADVTDGFKLDRGYSSALFINNQEKDECIFEDCEVLVCDAEIDNIFQIENVLKGVVKDQKKLLIIAPCSANMLNTLAANVVKNNVRICVVQPPNFGWKQHELMQDIALSLGANYFSEKTGDDLSLITMNDLGSAKKVVIGRSSSVIIKDYEINRLEIADKVKQLYLQHKSTKTKADKDHILNRIASLSGGIGVIYAGGVTDIEQKEKYDRIDDAVCAVRAAMEEGILPGGGVALYNYSILPENFIENGSMENNMAKAVLRSSLQSPYKQILENAGIGNTNPLPYDKEKKFNYIGYDVKRGENCDMIERGIIDPTKVAKSALLNAVSVATTILSTNAIITMARTYDANN